MTRTKSAILALVAVLLAPMVAQADLIDFTELTSGWQGTNTIVLSNATIATTGPDLFIATPNSYIPSVGPNGGFCGVTTTNGGDCSVDTTITFDSIISDLMFQTTAYNNGDTAAASIFSGVNLLATISYTANTIIDFSGYSGITSLFIDDLGSTGAGYVYGAFSFTTTTRVPEPGTLALLGIGLLGMGVARRRKKA